MIGQKLGHYRILEKIGAGGMGEVYRAHDEQLDREVALKVLSASSFSDPAARARLLREARSAAALNHPHICTIHEVGEADGQAYIAMEYVEGQPLSARLAEGPLPVEQALRYCQQIADALAHAHERGIVHRDLKSANAVITPEGRAKVLDFGLAKQLREEELETVTRSQASLTAEGAVMGTLAYMAPEQLRGQPADARSDVWALGAVLYEMLVGQRPFQGTNGYELSAAILTKSPGPLPSKVPVAVRAVVERCLAKEPGERYQRAAEVRAALEAIQAGAVAPWGAWRYQLTPRRWLAVVAVLVLMVATLVGLNVGGLREQLFPAGTPKIDSIAVLPMKNLMGDPEQDYFVEGMHEALITELSKISALKVISRTSTMRYKQTDKPLPEIARDLGVQGVIEGSVLREGDQVRITVQLIHGPSDRHLWGHSFDRELRGILALQSEVARTIAEEIKVKLSPAEQARLARTRPINPASYEAYLKGRYYWNERTPAAINRGIEFFTQALSLDANNDLAYVGLADSYTQLGYRAFLSPAESYPRAKAAALKALELNPELAEAYASLAFLYFNYELEWAASERAFQHAMELNPGYAEAHHWYAHYLMDSGRAAEALAETRRALELDPVSLIVNTHMGWHYSYERQFDKAIEHLRKTLQMAPDYYPGHLQLGRAYLRKGAYREALAELGRAKSLSQDSTEALAGVGEAYALAGQKESARRIVRELTERSQKEYVSAFDIAAVYTALGETKQAFTWLENAYRERASRLVEIKVDPAFDPLRDDPRFQDLLRRMNFPR